MRKLIPAVVFAASAAVSAPACPIGSFSAVDDLGNQICQTLDSGQTTTENCPIGTYPWVDNWGYKICQGVTTGAQFHDASGGCPIGTYQWADGWGNKSCRQFRDGDGNPWLNRE
jgi:hypothetical protein